MLVFAMLLAAQTPSLPVPSEDIIVTGRRMERLKRLRMTTTLDRPAARRSSTTWRCGPA